MRKSSIFETLEDLLLGRSYKYEANLLSHDDNQRVAHALCMWLRCYMIWRCLTT